LTNLKLKILKLQFYDQLNILLDQLEINIKTKHPEFLDWKWIELENLTEIAVHFKLEVYKKLKSEIKKILD